MDETDSEVEVIEEKSSVHPPRYSRILFPDPSFSSRNGMTRGTLRKEIAAFVWKYRQNLESISVNFVRTGLEQALSLPSESFKSIITTFRQLVRQEVYRVRDKITRGTARKQKRKIDVVDLEDAPDSHSRPPHASAPPVPSAPGSTLSALRPVPVAFSSPNVIGSSELEVFADMPPLESCDSPRRLPPSPLALASSTVSSSLSSFHTPPSRDDEKSLEEEEASEEDKSSSSSSSDSEHSSGSDASSASSSDGD